MKQLFIKDLDKYTGSDLHTMARYYGIKKLYPRTTLLKGIASKIMTKHQGKYKKAYMAGSKDDLPYGGDLSKARGAGDRDAIRKIVQWQLEQQESLPKESEESEIEEAKNCSNDTDFITQEKWTESPDIKIHFLDWENPDKKPYTICLKRDSFEKWITMPENYFARWVLNDPKKPMDDVGHGGHPLETQIYLKMPDGVTFVENLPTELGEEQVGIAIEQVRLGTLAGTFGISELHGQAPGYKIYRLMPKADYNLQHVIELLREYVGKDRTATLKVPGESVLEEDEDEGSDIDIEDEVVIAMQDGNVEMIIELLPIFVLPEFTGLYLSESSINDREIQTLVEALKTNTTVTDLNLADNEIGDTGAKALALLLEMNTTLTKLYLGDNHISDSGTQALAKALETNSTLTTLELRNNKINDVGAQALATALETNSTLTTLRIRYNNISPALEQQIEDIMVARQEDEPSGGTFEPVVEIHTAIRTAIQALETNSITELDLSDSDLDENMVELLAHALKTNTSLIMLNLGINNISDAGAQHLATVLEANATLTSLDLSYNKISDAGAQALAKALNMNTILTTLNLTDNNIGDVGAQALAQALDENSTLTTLDLRRNNITVILE